MKHRGYITLVSLLAILIICGSIFAFSAEAETYYTPASLYELADGSGYGFSGASSVSAMSYGRNTMGSFYVSGAINQQSTFRNRTAYGVEGTVSFSYSYDGAFQTDTKENWNIISDTDTSVNGIGLSGSIARGALIVQKSSDGSTWNNATNSVVDFFGTNPSGAANFYSTSGDDIKIGTYYRVIVAYKMGRKTGTSGFGPWKKDVFEYKQCVEVYEFYVCINTGDISIHNLAANVSAIEQEGYTFEQLKSGETLVNGSVTTQGFSIDKLGTSYLVSVSKNGGEAQYVNDGASFTENGYYTITAMTKLGKTVSTNVFIFNGGSTGGYTTYFGSSLVHGNRMLRYSNYPELTAYPTYARGSSAVFPAVDGNTPALHGYILNTTTGNRIDISGSRAEQSYALSAGNYYCEFSNDEYGVAGTTYHYTFVFSVLDEKSSPYINFYNLNHTDRFEDLQTKHYEVAYQTAGGGYIFVCFALDEYDAAWNYAYEIEKRFIEKASDGLYYKSMENPNVKVKYFDYVEMTAALNFYTSQNIEVNYFNATDEFTYNTYGNDMLDSLESMSLRESIKVFASKSDQEKLIDRQPFINHFTFIQAADFDSVRVEAYCKKNGKTTVLEYGKDVSDQLSVSSVYTIKETNSYGDVITYDAYFVNENTTRLDWKITYNGETETRRITNNDMVAGSIDVIADSVEVVSIVNELDSDSLIAIKAPEVYSFEIKCLLSEFKDLALYKKGRYEITVIDRLGNTFKINLTLTGKTRYSELPETATNYTAAYNAIYLNDKTDNEELYLDVTALKTALNRDVNPNYYTATSYTQYQQAQQSAQGVYDNVDASQVELDGAATALNVAYNALVPSTARAELEIELLRYENEDKQLFTTTSTNRWKAAYDLGQRVLEQQSAEELYQKAVNDLKMAYQSLVLRGNKDQLRNALLHAKLVNCYDYTPASIESLNAVFLGAFSVFQNIDAVQTEIDAATQNLANAESALVKMADFSKLWRAIDAVRSINPSSFTSASVNALKTQYDRAIAIYNDRNKSQIEINKVIEALNAAVDGLVLCGDKADLRKEMQNIVRIDYYLYSPEQLTTLHSLYLQACELISDHDSLQSELDDICNQLKLMRLSLKQDTSRQELYRLLTEIENGSLDGYKKKKAKQIANSYSSSAQALYATDTTEETIKDYIQTLNQLLGKEDSK